MNRREMLRALISAAAVPLTDRFWLGDWVTFGRDVHAAAAQASAGSAFRAVDAARAAVLASACERIIPADETPGATAAGVPAFIDRVLMDWCDGAERDRFVQGLDSIDGKCRADHGVGFADAGPVRQTALLEWFDNGLTEWRRTAAAPVSPGIQALPPHGFGMLKMLTIWGYFTSEIGQRQALRLFPRPTTFDGAAPYQPRGGVRR